MGEGRHPMTTEPFTRRILPVAEWDRIAARDLAALVPLLPPEDVQIVVVEQGDRLVACCGVLRFVHFEGPWIDPPHRTAAPVARHLRQGIFDAAQRWTPRWVMAGASDATMTDLITRHLDGQAMSMSLYAVPIPPGGDPCHRS